MDLTTVQITGLLPASPERVYQAWLDPQEHTSFTGGRETEVQGRVGAPFKAYDGKISGKVTKLRTNQLLSFAIRADSYPDEVKDSKLEITLSPRPDGTTEIQIQQSGVPAPLTKEFETIWLDGYFTPMRSYFTLLADRPKPESADAKPAAKASKRGGDATSKKADRSAASGAAKKANGSTAASARSDKAEKPAAKASKAAPAKKTAAKPAKAAAKKSAPPKPPAKKAAAGKAAAKKAPAKPAKATSKASASKKTPPAKKATGTKSKASAKTATKKAPAKKAPAAKATTRARTAAKSSRGTKKAAASKTAATAKTQKKAAARSPKNKAGSRRRS